METFNMSTLAEAMDNLPINYMTKEGLEIELNKIKREAPDSSEMPKIRLNLLEEVPNSLVCCNSHYFMYARKLICEVLFITVESSIYTITLETPLHMPLATTIKGYDLQKLDHRLTNTDISGLKRMGGKKVMENASTVYARHIQTLKTRGAHNNPINQNDHVPSGCS